MQAQMITNSPRISRWPQMTPELGHGDRQDHDNKETQDQEEPIALNLVIACTSACLHVGPSRESTQACGPAGPEFRRDIAVPDLRFSGDHSA
jgi:hypothetical protein